MNVVQLSGSWVHELLSCVYGWSSRRNESVLPVNYQCVFCSRWACWRRSLTHKLISEWKMSLWTGVGNVRLQRFWHEIKSIPSWQRPKQMSEIFQTGQRCVSSPTARMFVLIAWCFGCFFPSSLWLKWSAVKHNFIFVFLFQVKSDLFTVYGAFPID